MTPLSGNTSWSERGMLVRLTPTAGRPRLFETIFAGSAAIFFAVISKQLGHFTQAQNAVWSWKSCAPGYAPVRKMQVDPISSYNNQIAANALERLLQYAELAERRILYHANYLRDLGEAIQQMEAERAKNAELFQKFRRGP